MNDVFDEARKRISTSLIESYFYTQKSKWISTKNGREFLTLSPIRADENIGSFLINENGQFFDNATGQCGDIIDLLTSIYALTKLEAAKKIINDTGGGNVAPVKRKYEQNDKQNKKIEKGPAMFPIPDKQKNNIAEILKFKYNKYGRLDHIYMYKSFDNEWLFITARFENENNKNIIPFYFSLGGNWVGGRPPGLEKYPLYKICEIKNNDYPVLIVEGEKCARVHVDGFNLISWIGGTKNIRHSDWSKLENRNIITWPDNDNAGFNAADEIKEILPQSEILTIENKPEKWDIADAEVDGIDIENYIESCRGINRL